MIRLIFDKHTAVIERGSENNFRCLSPLIECVYDIMLVSLEQCWVHVTTAQQFKVKVDYLHVIQQHVTPECKLCFGKHWK